MPRPTAWANAAALFVFALGVRNVFAVVTPILIALMRHWPRLAWLGILLLWTSPVGAAAGIHAVVSRWLGLNKLTRAANGWAGFVAWATIIVVTIVTGLLWLVIDPPPVVDPDAVWDVVAVLANGGSSARAIIWIVLAAYVYELEIGAGAAPTDSPAA